MGFFAETPNHRVIADHCIIADDNEVPDRYVRAKLYVFAWFYVFIVQPFWLRIFCTSGSSRANLVCLQSVVWSKSHQILSGLK